jgi:uncharacterized coiled-coil DUF342 family protein
MTTRQQTEALISKTKRVVQRVSELKEKNKKLEDEVVLLKQQLEKEREAAKMLGEQIKMSKLAQHLSETSASERSELKRKVNEMIQTVDLCIAQLSEENGK